MSHDTEKWCKVGWKVWQKQGICEIECEQWPAQKCALWCATFVESILCLSQKTCTLKNDMKNLANFDPKFQNLHFNGLDKMKNKKLLNIVCIWIKSIYKIVLIYLFKTVFWSRISREYLQSKKIYLYYSKMKSLKTVKKFYDVAR